MRMRTMPDPTYNKIRNNYLFGSAEGELFAGISIIGFVTDCDNEKEAEPDGR